MIKIHQYFNEASGGLAPLINAVRDRKNISAFNLNFADRTIISSLVFPCVYVCADYLSASKAYEQFSALSSRAVLLNAKDDVLSYQTAKSGESAHNRFSALKKIAQNNYDVIVTTVEALIQLYPKRSDFTGAVIALEKNKEYNLDSLVKRLIFAGYRREAQITAKGHFSLRGDILDFWAPGDEDGVRLEFFGDLLESIKYFDIGEQTTKTECEKIEICPDTELFLSQDDIENVLKKLNDEFCPDKLNAQRSETILSELTLSLSAGDRSPRLSFIMPLCPHSGFFEFIAQKNAPLIIFDEVKMITDNFNVLYTEHENRYKTLLLKGEVLKSSVYQLINKDSALKTDYQKLAFHKLVNQNRIFSPDAVFNFTSYPITSYAKNYPSLIDDINGWLSQDYHIVLFCGTAAVKANFEKLLQDNKVGFNTGNKGKLELSENLLPYGATFHDDKLILLGTYNLITKAVQKTIKRAKSDVFSEPAVGGYVVHNVHGIGFCESVSRLEVNGAGRDYFVISYQGGDKLYVPIENMDSLTKFVSGDDTPKLSKIGGQDFAAVKEKVRASVKGMAINLVELYANRKNSKGHKYSDDNTFLDEFCAQFPYTETDDQLTAASEGLKDLTDGKIMDRLLCGDVGYGKTEVALRLAFKVITEGKQVAFISPTTILAKQHYNTVIKRMESFGVRIGSLTRFDSDAEIKKTLEKVAAKDIDIVVGTHRILSSDVKFADLGLLILDEEQRFGVADKEKIKKLKVNVNVLTLSATPIPRTLHMSMVGIRDISVLDTPPQNRVPVQTYVTEFTDSLVVDAINREVNRGGQVFIVYNRVETIEKFAFKVRQLLPDVRIMVGHGQLAENKLEQIISDFVGGGADVLIATTIIENGIDMPNANTMLVIDSDRFGLSQLYQLRGRVGRADRLAYVYFTFDSAKILTETAYKRLDAITEYTEFGSGFKIAMRDLEIRGAGNILGRQQHGHIEKVGYDMYCKLLESAVKELSPQSGETNINEEKEVKVNTDFNAFIPENYITDNEWRIRAYSRISRITTNEERVKFTKDLENIYGKIPHSAENLLVIAQIKNLAAKINASSVTLKKGECSINFSKTFDIPPHVSKIAQSRLKPLQSKIDFGSSRGDMLAFLNNCQK